MPCPQEQVDVVEPPSPCSPCSVLCDRIAREKRGGPSRQQSSFFHCNVPRVSRSVVAVARVLPFNESTRVGRTLPNSEPLTKQRTHLVASKSIWSYSQRRSKNRRVRSRLSGSSGLTERACKISLMDRVPSIAPKTRSSAASIGRKISV